jgi:lysophospholipase L1-like esterase
MKQSSITRFTLAFLTIAVLITTGYGADKPLKVFLLAGDEFALRQGSIDGGPMEPTQKPSPDDRDKPGTLIKIVEANPKFAFLRQGTDSWAVRKDVALYDAHPLTNNTRSPGRLLGIPTDPKDPLGYGVGVEHMFGHVVGERFDEPVLLIRFAAKRPTGGVTRGSRSLGYDYLPPSVGGGLDLQGGWDVIHFNFGVWDQQYLDPKRPNQPAEPGKGAIRTSIENYEKNLRQIVARLKETKATLIWANTTPILKGTPGYVGGDMVDKYNAVAAKIMQENGVLINDLNAECVRVGKPKALNVHDVGNLAPKVTSVLLNTLKELKNPSRPIPRVLIIGDSISGTYFQQVRRNLDGKAYVAHNPGNAEHSGTGVRLVNDWVDIKRYLLNGQEYLELVEGVKQTLADIKRYCPDFADHTPELAGVAWFQGMFDAQSDAFAAAYEKNLVSLISDLRAEFKQPQLPFVVGVLGQYGKEMSVNLRKVRDAQLAVADPAKYPKLGGKIAAVDTAPFYFPADRSPRGREWDYRSNAESFLLIGEAAGNEMLRMMK